MVKPWSRVVISLIGRPICRAARATMAVRWVSEPRLPKAPPTKGEITWMSSGWMPSCCASPVLKPHMFWLDSHTVSLFPLQEQAVVNSSMGL